jgi:photosystem II stability/assembly factor-like uncharacterized protein
MVDFISFDSKGDLLLASQQSGFYISKDFGATWVAINNGLPSLFAYSLTSSPSNDNELVGCTAATSTQPVMCFHSFDQGKTWTQFSGYTIKITPANTGALWTANGNILLAGQYAPNPLGIFVYSSGSSSSPVDATTTPTASSVWSFGINPVTHEIWAGTEGAGVYKSTNNGLTWAQAFAYQNYFGDIGGLGFSKSGQIITAGIGGIWLSTDSSGTNFTQVATRSQLANGFPVSLATDLAGNVYLGLGRAGTSGNLHSVYISKDGGHTWMPWDTGLPNSLSRNAIGINPGDCKVYFAAKTGGLFRTASPVQ